MLVGAVCLGIGISSYVLLAVSGTSIVSNGGFESGESPWTLYLGGQTGTFALSSNAYEGSSCMHLTATAVVLGKAVGVQQTIAPVVGETYVISFWYKATGDFMWYVATVDANWNTIDWLCVPGFPPTGGGPYMLETSEWTEFEQTIGPISASYDHAWVSFDLDSPGELYVDNVSITPYVADGDGDGNGDGNGPLAPDWRFIIFGGISSVGGVFLYTKKRD